MIFNTAYNKHIHKFISEDKKSEDEDKELEDNDAEDTDDDEKDTKDTKVTKGKDLDDEAPDNTGNEVIDSKMIELLIGEVETYLLDTKENFRYHIKYIDDSKLSGYVEYENIEDAERVYKSINTVGELLNYINLHAEMDPTLTPAVNIVKKEIIAIKRDLGDEDIAELALEFPV